MRWLVLCVLLAGLPAGGRAETAPSVMFDNPDPVYIQKQKGGDDARRQECRQLSQQMESLKGKPVRRAAIAERYEANCGGLYQNQPAGAIAR